MAAILRIGASLFFASLLSGCDTSDATLSFDLIQDGRHPAATFHGFMDNYETCMEVAESFNRRSESTPPRWSCAKTVER